MNTGRTIMTHPSFVAMPSLYQDDSDGMHAFRLKDVFKRFQMLSGEKSIEDMLESDDVAPSDRDDICRNIQERIEDGQEEIFLFPELDLIDQLSVFCKGKPSPFNL
jgi:hypothetical protein